MMFMSFNSNTTGATGGEGTTNPSGAHELTLGFNGCFTSIVAMLYQRKQNVKQELHSFLNFLAVRVPQFLFFCVVFCRSLYCLFFDSCLLITSFVSSNLSLYEW